MEAAVPGRQAAEGEGVRGSTGKYLSKKLMANKAINLSR